MFRLVHLRNIIAGVLIGTLVGSYAYAMSIAPQYTKDKTPIYVDIGGVKLAIPISYLESHYWGSGKKDYIEFSVFMPGFKPIGEFTGDKVGHPEGVDPHKSFMVAVSKGVNTRIGKYQYDVKTGDCEYEQPGINLNNEVKLFYEAGECRTRSGQTSVATQEEIESFVKSLIVQAPSTDWDNTFHLIEELRKPNQTSMSIITEGLQHKDPTIRMSALYTLSKLPANDENYALMMKAAKTDLNPFVRRAAILRFYNVNVVHTGYATRPETPTALTEILNNDPNTEVRESAKQALDLLASKSL